MPDKGFDPNRLLLAAALGLVILLVAGALFAQPLPAGSAFDARRALEVSQGAVGNRLGDYTLTGGNGRQLRLAELRGKPLVVSFVYTGCFQVCPTTTRFLARAVNEAQRTLGPGTFNVVTVGFNLPFDTPGAMRDFQQRYGVDLPNWHFAAADAPTIDGLARDVGFAWIPTAGGFDHVTQATIVDSTGHVVAQIYGDAFELPMFVGPLKNLVTGQPAASMSVADVLERVRILCTVYDPRSGRYRLNYALFIEIFAGVTVLGAVCWYVGGEWIRQRRLRRRGEASAAVAAPPA